MTRTRLIVAALAAALLAASPAAAGVAVRGADVSAYPTVRVSVVTTKPSKRVPRLTENGVEVAGVEADNLGRAKNVVLAIDRSQSMAGGALQDATAAARSFVSLKHTADEISIVAFGSRAVRVTDFSGSTTDADDALRALSLDAKQGTALYDAVVLSAQAFDEEAPGGRVIVLLTDGSDVSSKATHAQAVEAARKAGAVVFTIAVQSSQFSPAPLRELAAKTGGAYFGVSSSAALARVYRKIAEDLSRTWRLEYSTSARPGERLELEATVGSERARAAVEIPGDFVAPSGSGQVVPTPVLRSVLGTVFLALVVGGLVGTAVVFVLLSRQGSWLQRRLSPHLSDRVRRAERAEKAHLAAASALFGATERYLGHLKRWRRLERKLEQAKIPLKTAEFVYLMAGSAFFFGLVAAVFGMSSVMILGALGVGALAPYSVVWWKARKRRNAFEEQLPDLLLTLAAALKAGHSFKQGIQTVVDEGQEPASEEFKRVLTDAQLGRPMDEALPQMTERVGSKNFEFVITAVTIQRQVGGSLAGLFDMVAETVRQRQQFARKIKALTAMGRASAYVLIGLPFFMAAGMTLLNGQYMDPLYHTSTGHKMIFGGLLMMGFGSLILKKIVSFRG